MDIEIHDACSLCDGLLKFSRVQKFGPPISNFCHPLCCRKKYLDSSIVNTIHCNPFLSLRFEEAMWSGVPILRKRQLTLLNSYSFEKVVKDCSVHFGLGKNCIEN